ncbi:MAG: LuxR C-terminal-related transcriptional regulator [Burkholderiaceae bacterium]
MPQMGNPELVLAPLSDKSTVHLTPREVEVARFLAYGASNKQIAQKLDVSDFTVRDHVSCLLKKFEVDSRARLAVVLSSGFVVGQVFLSK